MWVSGCVETCSCRVAVPASSTVGVCAPPLSTGPHYPLPHPCRSGSMAGWQVSFLIVTTLLSVTIRPCVDPLAWALIFTFQKTISGYFSIEMFSIKWGHLTAALSLWVPAP